VLNLETHAAEQFSHRSRRDFLRAGFLAMGGLTLADVARMRANGTALDKDTSVILLFVHGGPSHLETYDMKPNAPDDIRGPFKPTKTTVPGIHVCEHLPEHAKRAHQFSLIRSVSHDEADHFAGHRRFLSGFGKLKQGTSYEPHYPQVGAVVTRAFHGKRRGLPPALNVGGVVVNGPDYAPGCSEGYWSGIYRVPIVNGGLRDVNLAVDGRRFDDRLSLLKDFDKLRRDLDTQGSMVVMDEFNRQALDVILSGKAREAFDLSREAPRVRDKFGDGYGQEVLTARRLVEAGVRFVTVRIPGSGVGTKAYDWDDHAVNWDMLGAMNARLPKYDRVISTLIDDLYERGLNEKVLLIVTGEFGRTPRLERMDGKIGRDHWPSAMSILVSGGGMPMGQVIGATDQIGGAPKERRFDPHDFLATIYHHLGIDHRSQFPDQQGRPVFLTEGEPIRELVG